MREFLTKMRYLGQKQAQQLDQDLMDPEKGGFSLDQLMELAGLSVAEAVLQCYPKEQFPRILVCAGPGNNGGDALVAARHLWHFGYQPTLYYPKRPVKLQGLVKQCEHLLIPFVDQLDFEFFDLILDGIFGGD